MSADHASNDATGAPPNRTANVRSPVTALPARPVSLLYVATIAPTIRQFLVPYAAHFRAMGWHVSAAANGAGDDAVLRDAFDAVYDLPLSRSIIDVRSLVRGERAVARMLETGPDVVHVHTPIASFITRFAGVRRPRGHRPVIAYSAHGFHFHAQGRAATNALFRTAEQVAGRWTDRLVVMNHEDLEAARRHRIVAPRRLVYMPGIGIDTGHYARSSIAVEAPLEARRDLGLAPDAPLFACVAELNRNKRIGDAIQALAAMNHRDATLLLLGAGLDEERLRILAEREGVRDRVVFGGFVREIRPMVAAATALILPSQREGLNRSVMEALSLETPVIASTARGNRELIGVDSGIVVPIGDVAGYAAAMDRLIDSPEERLAMGRRGRARMVEGFDLRILINRHEEMYRQMLGERRRSDG